MKTRRWNNCLLTELIAVMLVITHMGGMVALADEEFEVIPDIDAVCIENDPGGTEERIESGMSLTDEEEPIACLIEDLEKEEPEPDGLTVDDTSETESEDISAENGIWQEEADISGDGVPETDGAAGIEETETEYTLGETVSEEITSEEMALMEAAADNSSESAGELTLKQSEVTLYYASDNLKNQKEIPADKPGQYKIELSQTYDGNVTYSYWSKDNNCSFANDLYVDLTEDGVITAKKAGESMIRVRAGSSVMFLTVHVKSYDREYVENILDSYIQEHILPLSTQKEQAEAIVRYVAENYSYSASYSGYVSMGVNGAGDCWASTDMIQYMCKKAGIPSEMWIEDKENFGVLTGGHMKAIIYADGEYYIGEAGYVQQKPRRYDFYKLSGPFSIEKLTDTTCEITRYDGVEGDVVIPEKINGFTVTSIGHHCFYRTGVQITSVRIPDTVTNIGKFAFAGCSQLSEMMIPASVTSIGSGIFWSDISLKEIKVDSRNSSYKSIDGVLFSADGKVLVECPRGLTGAFVVPEGTEEIQAAAFSGSEITEVTIPGSVRTIGNSAFQYSKLNKVTLNEGLVTIGECAFASTYTKSITIPSSVKSIQAGALQNITRGILVLTKDAEIGTEAMPHGYIAAYPGSTAQAYAEENNYRFTELDSSGRILLKDEWFALKSTEYTYSGREMRPEVSVSGSIVQNNQDQADYTVTYENNTDAGCGYAVINGINRFSGTVRLPFTVQPQKINMSSLNTSVAVDDCFLSDYSNGCEPQIEVYTGSYYYRKTYTQGKDYTVVYAENKDLGEATATITMTGNYTADTTKTITFRVYEHLPEPEKIEDVVYNGNDQKPDVAVNGLSPNEDYGVRYTNNRETGVATATVIGMGYYRGEKTVEFNILPCPIERVEISVNASDIVYSGKEQRPKITVYHKIPYTVDEKTYYTRRSLEEGKDYSVIYKNNVNAGTAGVTLTGMGNYTDEKTETFTIKPASIYDVVFNTMTLKDGQVSTEAQYSGMKLTEGVDYSTELKSYYIRLSAAEKYRQEVGTVLFRGIGNFGESCESKVSGERESGTFIPIAPIDDRTYIGQDICPKAEVLYDGNTLTEGTDYSLSYRNNRYVGTGTVRISGIGNYRFDEEVSFSIVEKKDADDSTGGIGNGDNDDDVGNGDNDGITSRENEEHRHTFGSWRIVRKATAVSTGMKCRVCSCGATESKPVARLRATGRFNRKKVMVRKGKTYRKLSVTGLAEGDYVVSVRSTKKKVLQVKNFDRTGKIVLKGKQKGRAKLIVTLASGRRISMKVKCR